MGDATRSRAFQPFVSTHPRWRGTGLGLPMVHGLVIKAGGRVEIVSAPGTESTARTPPPRAPAVEASVRVAEPGSQLSERPVVVMVVDDEPAIRTSVSRFLRHRGYQTLEAANGELALEQLEAMEWAVDLLLTDMVMPRMGGRELVLHVRARHPQMAVLCMSGHMEAPAEESDEPWGGRHVVSKPFELQELARRVGLSVAR